MIDPHDRRVARHEPSTISREIGRNEGFEVYRASQAGQTQWYRARRPKPWKLCCIEPWPLAQQRRIRRCSARSRSIMPPAMATRHSYLTLAEIRSEVLNYIEHFHNPIIQRRLDSRDQTFRLLTQQSV